MDAAQATLPRGKQLQRIEYIFSSEWSTAPQVGRPRCQPFTRSAGRCPLPRPLGGGGRFWQSARLLTAEEPRRRRQRTCNTTSRHPLRVSIDSKVSGCRLFTYGKNLIPDSMPRVVCAHAISRQPDSNRTEVCLSSRVQGTPNGLIKTKLRTTTPFRPSTALSILIQLGKTAMLGVARLIMQDISNTVAPFAGYPPLG